MDEVVDVLKRWKLDTRAVRERMYRAPTQRDRERWRAVWLLAEDWSAAQTADVLKRDPHTNRRVAGQRSASGADREAQGSKAPQVADSC